MKKRDININKILNEIRKHNKERQKFVCEFICELGIVDGKIRTRQYPRRKCNMKILLRKKK